MIRQQAFIDKGNKMLKGGLHCHTTRSDGAGAPDEVIRLHYENGYHVMARTDHNVVNHVNHADVPMTMLSGIERDLRLPGRAYDKPHCVHVWALACRVIPLRRGRMCIPGMPAMASAARRLSSAAAK